MDMRIREALLVTRRCNSSIIIIAVALREMWRRRRRRQMHYGRGCPQLQAAVENWPPAAHLSVVLYFSKL